MEEVLAAEGVMSQSLFDLPGGSQPGGVLEQMVEGQEQLRAELGLVAERLEGLERGQATIEAETRAAIVELGRRPAASRAPLYAAVTAVLLAAAALVSVLVFLSP
ncbi:MAG: hypothetical protein ACREM9_09525 [Gemmatimonadales bacterium]